MAEESNTLDTTQRLLELFAEFQAKLKQLLPEFFPEAPAPIPPPKVSDKMRKVQEIADKMGWELCTLRTYLSRFEKRIGVKGKAAIVGWAVKMGLD
jgi:hypothetical protein